ncbi:MAG: hypothetical protein U0746_12735 [Gemmataceae bacterium]
MKRWSVFLAAFVALVANVQADTIRDQLYRLPNTVNAVVLVNMDAVFNSPRGKREGWAKLPHGEVLGGSIPVNPAIDRIIIGSHFSPTQGTSASSIALVPLAQKLTIEQIANLRKGRIETISGQQVVATPHGYFAEVKPGLIAGMTDTGRTEFVKYLKFARDNGLLVLAPYLVTAVQNEIHTPIVIAFDTEDAIDPKTVAAHVAASKALAGQKEAADQITKFLSAMKGVRIFVEIGDVMKATVYVDGAGPYPGDPNLLKAFLLETLGHAGANLDVISEAVPRPSPTGIAYITDLTNAGLMRLMTLLDVPPTAAATPVVQPSPDNAREVRIAATRRYYNAVVAMLNDLDAEYRRATSYNATANWHEGYARRIDALPTVDVDQAVLAWGAAAAYDLRALAASLRGVKLKIDNLEGKINVTVPFIGNAGWGVGAGGRGMQVFLQTNLGEVRQKQTEAVQQGQADRNTVWKLIQSDREQVRQRILDQYGVDLAK